MKKYKLAGIGNGIIDLLVSVDDSFLADNLFVKGSMDLVSQEIQDSLISNLSGGDFQVTSGGSVCNSIVAFSELGSKAAFLTCIGDDENSKKYLNELAKFEIDLNSNCSISGEKIGNSLVMITPDSERTMRTSLAIAGNLSEDHVDEEIIKNSEYLFIEGYLVANPEYGQGAILKCIEYAKKHDTKLILTLSDAFIPNVFADFVNSIIGDIDILFANEVEAEALTKIKNAEESAKELVKKVPHVIVTASENGAYIASKEGLHHQEAEKCTPVDLTGAGDTFAAGYLYGIINGLGVEKSAKIATLLAKEVITSTGARLGTNSKEVITSLSL